MWVPVCTLAWIELTCQNPGPRWNRSIPTATLVDGGPTVAVETSTLRSSSFPATAAPPVHAREEVPGAPACIAYRPWWAERKGAGVSRRAGSALAEDRFDHQRQLQVEHGLRVGEVDVEHLLHPAQPVGHGVRVHVQGLGGDRHRAPVG